MNWICENCSTYNPESNKSCFVCDTKRSRESIAKAKRLAREALYERLRQKTYDWLTKGGKIIFISAIIVFSVVALISLYLTMQKGAINDIVFRGAAIVHNAGINIMSVIRINCRSIIDRLAQSPIMNIPRVVREVGYYILSSLSCGFDNLRSAFISNNVEKYDGLIDIIDGIKSIAGENITHLLTAVWFIVINSIEHIRSIVNNLLNVIQRAKEQILQFT